METTDITSSLDAMGKELKSFTGEVKASVDKLDKHDAETSARLLQLEQRIASGPSGSGSRLQEVSERAPRDPATGMPILSKAHRFADNLPQTGNEQPKLDLDVMWRGILCNRWPSRDCPERKALGEASGSAGGFTLPLIVSAQYIDFARAASVCIQAGARTLPMDNATLRVPVLATDIVCTWKQENADITEVNPTLDKRDAVAHTLIGLLYMSLELAEDSPLISTIVSSAFARSMGQQLDAAALVGNATYGPLGLRNNPAVHATLGAGSLDWDDVSRAIQAVRYRNYSPNAFVLDPGGSGTLSRLKATGTGNYLSAPTDVAALEQFFTSAVGADVFVGAWENLWFFPRTGINIEVTREGGTSFTKGQIGVRAYLRADVLPVAPAAFEIIEGYTS